MKQFLPIGSVVLLKNSTKRVMIIGVKQREVGTEKLWDNNLMSNSNDKTVGGSISLTPKETKYLLFGKKKCPICKGKLVKKKKFILADCTEENKKLFAGSATPASYKKGYTKEYYYEFKCLTCGESFALQYLSNL